MKLLEIFKRRLGGRVAQGATGLLALRCIFLGLGFVQAVLVARLAGPAGYGAYAFALAVVNLAVMFACMGFGQLAVREVAAYMAREQWSLLLGFLRRSHHIAGLMSLAVAAVLAAVAFQGTWIEGDTRKALLVFAFCIPFLALGRIRLGLLHGFGAVVRSQTPEMLVRPVFFVSLLLVAFVLGRNLSGFEVAILVSIGVVAAFAAGTWLLRREVQKNVPEELTPEFNTRYWLAQGTPFMLVAGVGFLNQELGTLMLGTMVGTEATGLYQPVLRIAAIMLLPHAVLYAALAPRIAALHARNETVAMERLLIKGARATFLIGILWIAVLTFATPIILQIFGKEFIQGSDALLYIAVGQIVAVSTGFSGLLLAMTGRQIINVYSTGLGCGINFVLCLILIPILGLEGAAIGTGAGIAANYLSLAIWAKFNVSTKFWFFNLLK